MANRVLERGRDTLSLVISNFRVDNYGQYHCRCITDYSNSLLFSSGRHINQNDAGKFVSSETCSVGATVVNLLPAGRLVSETVDNSHHVSEVGDLCQLTCESGNWSIWKPWSSPDFITDQYTLNFTISRSADQTKAVCLNPNNTLGKIFYVSIRNYHQLLPKLIRPSVGTHDITVALNDDTAPVLCIFQLSTANTSYVSRNGRKLAQNVEISFLTRKPLRFMILGPGIFYTAVSEDIAAEWYNSTFSCGAEGIKWEDDVEAAAFTLTRPGESGNLNLQFSTSYISSPNFFSLQKKPLPLLPHQIHCHSQLKRHHCHRTLLNLNHHTLPLTPHPHFHPRLSEHLHRAYPKHHHWFPATFPPHHHSQ
jgi:hypothetical protein